MRGKRKSGLAFHCHHNVLYEFVLDYDGRITDIIRDKPAMEQELRLRLFKLIPEDRLPGRDSPEWRALVETSKAFSKLDRRWHRRGMTFKETYVSYNMLRHAIHETRQAFVTAWKAYHAIYDNDITRLHDELCPNCPWDGESIFPEDKKE